MEEEEFKAGTPGAEKAKGNKAYSSVIHLLAVTRSLAPTSYIAHRGPGTRLNTSHACTLFGDNSATSHHHINGVLVYKESNPVQSVRWKP